MKILSVLLVTLMMMSFTGWKTDMNMAKKEAKEGHKLILLNFSGSDWCAPCIRMHKDIFEDAAFKKFSDDALVLVNADFPRLKKNQLSKTQQEQNDLLAEQYNTKGIFPLTVLLDEEGKVLKSWEGLPRTTATEFTTEIHAVLDVRH